MKALLKYGFLALVMQSTVAFAQQKLVADNMLLYQRVYGGWPKHIGGKKINYEANLTAAEKAQIADDASLNDGTIDNNATTKEIRYLAKAFTLFGDSNYLKAVQRGVKYLLTAQYDNGGFPQFYPDTASLYRGEITFNDNAMINALQVLYDIAEQRNEFNHLLTSEIAACKKAVELGITCILNSQIIKNKHRTVWCAQHNQYNYLPAKARKYELPSFSGAESVGILKFLMQQPNPTEQIKISIVHGVNWLKQHAIHDSTVLDTIASKKTKQKDRFLVYKKGSVVWARFYDLDTELPFLSGRDGIKKHSFAEIEYERRMGYKWFGEWPLEIIEKQYNHWLNQHQVNESALLAIQEQRLTVGKQAGQIFDFDHITQALQQAKLDTLCRYSICIDHGVYNEKLFIQQPYISLYGNSKTETIITQSIARDIWRCTNADDWGVATVNVKANDISLQNLTIINNYGLLNTEAINITCNTDSGMQTKKVSNRGHQMALRTMNATKFKAINCSFISYGGDTVSPWDVDNGLFYFKDCYIEGGVDMYCPRGWALAENCTFNVTHANAAVWHDGSKHEDSKSVFFNCYFDGYNQFKLGRYHRDAQFYFIQSTFSLNMADSPIYLVKTNNTILWGHRVHFLHCTKPNEQGFAWLNDNINPNAIPAAHSYQLRQWIFKQQWNNF